MWEILYYSFFQNALLWGIFISLIASTLGVLVVMRKETNITHSISNFLFLWIAVSLLLNGNYYFYSFLFWIIGSFLIFFIEKTRFITKESTKEIISQAWIAGGIFVIWFLWNLTLDINNFLFWSILFISHSDLIILCILLVIWYILFFFFGKKFLSVIINQDIAKTRWTKVDIYNFVFLIFLSLFISLSIKIFWILLIGAFLVIPANISKIISPSLKQSFFIASFVSIISVILGLFTSYFLSTSSGATIVLILIVFFMLSIFLAKRREK
jgi:zinc transport system permease protein